MDILLERFRDIIKGVDEPFVIECGACDGYHSNKMLAIIKEKDRAFIYHGFEPNWDLHIHILNNLKGHLMFNRGVISVFPDAVGAVNEETIFYKSSGRKFSRGKVVDHYYGSSSILKPKVVKESFPSMWFKEDKVNVISLDTHLENYGLGCRIIDFIWCDIQGGLAGFIVGAFKALQRTRYLYTEYDNSEQYEGQIVGIDALLELLPTFEIVEDYGGDVLLKNLTL